MADNPPPVNPNYGAVTTQPDGIQQAAAGQTYPTEPPPKYEPPKGQDLPYPPQQQQQQYPPPQQPYPPQQQPYPAGYQVPPPVQDTTVILVDASFGPVPTQCQCPNCRAVVVTSISHEPGGLTWLASGLICLFGCWAGCCLLPFCIGDMQDVVHRCPNCHRHIGTYRRL